MDHNCFWACAHPPPWHQVLVHVPVVWHAECLEEWKVLVGNHCWVALDSEGPPSPCTLARGRGEIGSAPHSPKQNPIHQPCYCAYLHLQHCDNDQPGPHASRPGLFIPVIQAMSISPGSPASMLRSHME